ncbi:MAG: S-layer homology domain-containing protein [Clostridia bacterium]|nr:S-layer homology domain-containing protein [Clostridia bacterium]
MKRIRFVIVSVILIVLTSVTFITASAADGLPFTDVKNDWYYSSVEYVWQHGIMRGLSDTLFSPFGKTTRAEIVTILSRLSGDDIEGLSVSVSFKDVKPDGWYGDAVGWGMTNKIVNGYEDNTFRPNSPVTRQELAALIARYMDLKNQAFPDNPLISSFKDGNKIAKWAYEACETVRLAGIIGGDEKGNFNPTANATRAEIATMIMRYMENVTDPMFDKLEHLYDLTEGEGRRVDINLLLRERITGSGTPFSLSEQILPQLGLSTDTYEIEIDKNHLENIILETDCNMLGDNIINVNWEQKAENQGVTRIRIRNKTSGEETAFKTIIFNVKRTSGPLVGLDPEEFDPAISTEVYDEMKRIAQYSLGDPARYAAFIEKAEKGEPVTVAYIGGSITRGASGGPYHNWTRLMQNWLEKTFPKSEMTFVNAGIDGTGSFYGNMRLESNVLDHEPDLFFIEFALNDGSPNDNNMDGFESMIRRVLSSEKKPAIMVLLVGFSQDSMCNYMKSVSDYYGISVADYCAAAKYALQKGEIYSGEIAYDGSHPREWGHNFMAQTLLLNFKAIMEKVKTASPEELVIKDIPEERISAAINEDLISDRPSTYTPESSGQWEVVNDVYKFGSGWRCDDTTSEFVYEFTGKTLYVMTGHSDGPDFPEIESDNVLISIDGGEFTLFNCDRYATVINEETSAHHRLVIKAADEGSTVTIAEFVHH